MGVSFFAARSKSKSLKILKKRKHHRPKIRPSSGSLMVLRLKSRREPTKYSWRRSNNIIEIVSIIKTRNSYQTEKQQQCWEWIRSEQQWPVPRQFHPTHLLLPRIPAYCSVLSPRLPNHSRWRVRHHHQLPIKRNVLNISRFIDGIRIIVKSQWV